MTSARLSLLFACLGHALMHLFAAFYFIIVLSLERHWGLPYHQVVELWGLGSLLIGLAALPAGWLGDRWSAPGMMVVMFLGMGAASVFCGLVSGPRGMLLGLAGLGLFAAIYHPVGVAWVVRSATARGKALGINGIFGSVGVAAAGLVAGTLIELGGWRAAFIVPGLISLGSGLALWWLLWRGRIRDVPAVAETDADTSSRERVRAFLVLVLTMLLMGLIYQSTQAALPKLFSQRLHTGAWQVGLLVALVYAVAGVMQIVGGHLADRLPLKRVYLGGLLVQAPVLALVAHASGAPLVLAATMAAFLNAATLPAENLLIARFAPARHRSLAYAVKFVLAFSIAPVAVLLVARVEFLTGEFFWLFLPLAAVAVLGVLVATALPGGTTTRPALTLDSARAWERQPMNDRRSGGGYRSVAIGILTVVMLVAGLASMASAELIIRMRDGSRYRIPIDVSEVESMHFRRLEPATGAPAETMPDSAPAEEASAQPQSETSAAGRVWRVGPERLLKTPSAAAKLVRDGDIVAIDAGVYRGDVAIWKQNNLTLRGEGGMVELRAGGRVARGKAIWIIHGDRVVVENIAFSEARASSRNGAGIRFGGGHLSIRHCRFFDNEMGILTNHDPNSEVVIEFSEFFGNVVDYERYGRLGHNIYIGEIGRFTLRGSYIHGAVTGHNVKTRARENYLLYNRIMDREGAASYLVDMVTGGRAVLLGNVFQQAAAAENFHLLAFASGKKHRENPDQALYVVNNTFVNDRPDGVFIANYTPAAASVINNLFVGKGVPVQGPADNRANRQFTDGDIIQDRAAYDYRLRAGAAAIDQGAMPGETDWGFSLRPTHEVTHGLEIVERQVVDALDIGAHEWQP